MPPGPDPRDRRGPEPDTRPERPRREGELAATAVLGAGPELDPERAPSEELELAAGEGGRYQPRELLGKGGMGEVWLAVDRRIGREVALKVATIAPGDGAAAARFVREAKLQGQLDHPGVVPVHDLGTRPDGSVFFTMQRVRGQTLAAIIAARGAGDPEVVRRYTVRKLLVALVSVCHAVEAAHAQGLVHRDLKPANIMLGGRGEVYVLDWGLAKPIALERPSGAGATVREAGAPAAAESLPGLTAAGQFLGTPGYMAPEQARGEPVDQRADVYALGAILFEALSSTQLIPRGSAVEVLASTAAGPDVRASLRGHPAVPVELEEVCARAAAPGLGERLPSVAALREGIEAYLDGDRDLAARQLRADRLTIAGKADVERALAGDAAARSRALAALGRALALEPEHVAAQRALLELMVSPPSTAPAEVERAVAAAEAATFRRVASAGTWIYLAWLPFGLVMMWLGIKQVAPLLAWVACTVGTVLTMIVASTRTEPSRGLFITGLVLSSTGIVLVSRITGTLVLTPTLFTLNAVGFAIAARRAWLIPTVAVSAAFLVTPALLEATGVLTATTVVEGGMLQVTSTVIEFHEPATSIAAVGATLIFLIMVIVATASLRRRFLEQTRRVELAMWQLRQLVPRFEPALPTPPAPPPVTPPAAG